MTHTIHAVSFDADNCLFHVGYNPTQGEINSGNCQQVITKNKPLLDTLKAQSPNFKKTIVLVGSLRQSVAIDQYNVEDNTTESVFTAIQKIAQYLGATLDKFLLTDVEANVAPGTSFDHAINQPSEKQETCTVDITKVSFLYAQIHKLANQYPNESILFDFYDDCGLNVWNIGDDVLEHLYAYFTQHPELLPSNVTLRLNHYEGKDVTPYTDIEGTGFIDAQYQQTTRDIAAVSQFGFTTLPKITPAALRHRTPLDTDAGYTTDKATSSAAPSPNPSPVSKPSNLSAHYLGSLFYDLGFTDADNDIIEEHCENHRNLVQNSPS